MDSELKKKLKSKFVLFALILIVITSIGFTITSKNKLNSVEREITGVVSTFEPSHECKDRELSFYCFSLSSTLKTCYTLPDRKGGKRCLVEPFWEEIIYEDPLCPEKECPEIKCEVCQEPITCPVLNFTWPTCVQTCNGCGGGGGSYTEKECPENRVIVLAYTDYGDYYCNRPGPGQKCINQDDLSEKQLDELGW